MKSKLIRAIAALALLTGTHAAAEDVTSGAPAEKKICKTERVTGSRTRVNKICMTKAEWDMLAQHTQKAVGDQVQHSGIYTAPTQSPAGGPG